MNPLSKRALRQFGFLIAAIATAGLVGYGLDHTALGSLARDHAWVAYPIAAALYVVVGIALVAAIAGILWLTARYYRRERQPQARGRCFPH